MANIPTQAQAEQAKTALTKGGYEATVAGELQRIEDSKTVIAYKVNEFVGLTEANAQIDDAALKLYDIIDHGNVSHELKGPQKSFPAGYYAGIDITLGDISELYDIQPTVSVTPSKTVQTITPTGINPATGSAYDALSKVIVNAIPATWYDVSECTLTEADSWKVLTGEKYICGDNGKLVLGTMTDNSAWASVKLDTATTTITIPRGYHPGNKQVYITPEVKTLNYNTDKIAAGATINPTAGKVLSSVVIPAVPDTGLFESDVVKGETYYSNGQLKTGTMEVQKGIRVSLTPTNNSYNMDGLYRDLNSTRSEVNVTSTELTPVFDPAGGVHSSKEEFYTKVTIPAVPNSTIVPEDVTVGKIYYANGAKYTGTLPSQYLNKTLTPTEKTIILNGRYTAQSETNKSQVTVATTTASPTFNPAGQEITASTAFLTKITIPAVPFTGILSSDVLEGKSYYEGGVKRDGTMQKQFIQEKLTPKSDYYDLLGYYSEDDKGNRSEISVQSSICSPSFNAAGQTINATDSFFNKVIIPKVPGTATSSDQVLTGHTVYANGVAVNGSIVDVGTITKEVDLLAITDAAIYTLYDLNIDKNTVGKKTRVNGLKVQVTDTLYKRLAAI